MHGQMRASHIRFIELQRGGGSANELADPGAFREPKSPLSGVNWCVESSKCTGPVPLALTQTARKRSPVERYFRRPMGELLTLGPKTCSLFALFTNRGLAHVTGHKASPFWQTYASSVWSRERDISCIA
jgi:hypothetical protein